MDARFVNAIVSVVLAGTFMVGCSGEVGESATVSSPSAELTTPAPEGTEALPKLPTDSAAPAEPTPEPTSVGPLPITSDNLVDALPRPGQMTNIQGRKFIRELDAFPDEPGADWAADAPLTNKQRNQINLGTLRKTKPAICEFVAFLNDGTTAVEWSGQDYITSLASSWMVQELKISNVRRSNQIREFNTRIYVMPPGEAEIWLNNAVNTLDRCARYKQVDAKGKITNVVMPVGSLRRSNDAYVWENTGSVSGIKYRFADMWEVVGNALLITRISTVNPTAAGNTRAATVFNNIADKLAKDQGITRSPLDLDGLTKFKQDPSLVESPSLPASAQA